MGIVKVTIEHDGGPLTPLQEAEILIHEAQHRLASARFNLWNVAADAKINDALKPASLPQFDDLRNEIKRYRALGDTVATRSNLKRALAAYEATGDHDHGFGDESKPIAPGAPCPGGDCLVSEARELLKLD